MADLKTKNDWINDFDSFTHKWSEDHQIEMSGVAYDELLSKVGRIRNKEGTTGMSKMGWEKDIEELIKPYMALEYESEEDLVDEFLPPLTVVIRDLIAREKAELIGKIRSELVWDEDEYGRPVGYIAEEDFDKLTQEEK